MVVKDTDKLMEELTSTPDLEVFLEENQNNFNTLRFCDLLTELFNKSGLTKAALSKRAGTSEVYLYQIFSGMRTPSRDRTLCLCFGLSCTLDETQTLLKESGLAQLYPKNKRDAIIIYCLSNGMSLQEANEKLYSGKEDILV